MEQWNYTWEDSRKFEHPLPIQEYEFRLGTYHGTMVPQQYLQDQYFGSRLSFIEEMTAYLQKSAVDDDKRWRESQERSAKIDQLIEQIQVDCFIEKNQELTNLQLCKLHDSDSLHVHNDTDMHSYGAKREENVPLSHLAINIVHHDVASKEDGNREDKIELPGNGLDDRDVRLPSSRRGVNKAADKKKKKKKGLMTEVFDIFSKADVNSTLLDLISKVPTYAEFVRKLCMHKKKLPTNGKIVLKEEVSSIIQQMVSPDIHDPTSFVIGCTIDEKLFDGALMDMGTNINIMPLATFRKLAIGSLQPTSISVQLADGTFRMPLGIVEDVLIKVDKFILPADFVILDMDEDPEIENGLPIILGRPFMAMVGAKVNVQKGTVKLKILGEKVKLQVFQPVFPHNVIKEVFSTDLMKGNQAKRERIFGPLNSPKPLIQDPSLPVIAEHVQQEQCFMEDDSSDDDMFAEFMNSYGGDDKGFAASTSESELDSFCAPLSVHKTEAPLPCVLPELDMDPHFMGQQTSSFEQAHQLNEFASLQGQEVVKLTSTIHEHDQGIPPTPYIPPHRRGLLPTPYLHPYEHRLSSSFESFQMNSPPCNEVQLEAIQCLREILGIGVNKMKTHNCHPTSYASCKSWDTPYMSCYGGRQLCFAPP